MNYLALDWDRQEGEFKNYVQTHLPIRIWSAACGILKINIYSLKPRLKRAIHAALEKDSHK